jgi:hypothetical protein
MHERHRPRPGRDRVQRLRQGHADHGPEQVAGSAGPAGRLKSGDEVRYFGRVEDAQEVFGDGSPCYVLGGHGGSISMVQTPGGSSLARVSCSLSKP